MSLGKISITVALVALCIVLLSTLTLWSQTKPKAPDEAQIMRGMRLVMLGGCNDCHSPKVFGPRGPKPDPSKVLAGAPAGVKLPPLPKGAIAPDQWGALCTNDMTSWVGMWGATFAVNLTPDKETGLGDWTLDMFKEALRTGQAMGLDRPILPPMPWEGMAGMTDQEFGDLFAYLMSLKPIKNQAPSALPPDKLGIAPPPAPPPKK